VTETFITMLRVSCCVARNWLESVTSGRLLSIRLRKTFISRKAAWRKIQT